LNQASYRNKDCISCTTIFVVKNDLGKLQVDRAYARRPIREERDRDGGGAVVTPYEKNEDKEE
jgi:hypothetical protein